MRVTTLNWNRALNLDEKIIKTIVVNKMYLKLQDFALNTSAKLND